MKGCEASRRRADVGMLVLAALACVCLPACETTKQEGAPSAAKGGSLTSTPPGKETEEEQTPPTESRFLGELAKTAYPEAKPPDTPPVLQWDFSAKGVRGYAYEQTVKANMDMGAPMPGGGKMDQTISSKGKLLVKSLGDHTARMVLQDLTMTMTVDFPGREKPESMESTFPTVVIQGMREDGSLKTGDSSQEALLALLFPLPPKALKVGESVDVPDHMPFNAMGSLLMVQGRSRITLTKYVTIGGHRCARLDTDIDISRLDVPPEVEGKYACTTKGASVFYFDIEDRRFVSGTVALLMSLSADMPSFKMKVPGGKAPQLPERMSMVSDNLIRITPLEE